MPNNFFTFKQFTIRQQKSVFRVGTDGVLLGACANVEGVRTILDIGTGTGLIALMLAQRSSAEIFAIEPDHDSFIQASENIAASPRRRQVRIFKCRLQDYFPHVLKFELIVSNPPYFIDSLINPDNQSAAARHNISLTQDDLLEGVVRLLDPAGRLEVIMPYQEGNILIVKALNHRLYCNSVLKIKPVQSSEVKRLILSFSRQKSEVKEQSLIIEKDRRHHFTEEYKTLTRDFYLKF